jgi:GTP-binding protein Era
VTEPPAESFEGQQPEGVTPPDSPAAPGADEAQAAPAAEGSVPPGFRAGIIAVVGRPNVGKSTLMNHYLGTKIAITSPRPQTTRRTQLGILTRPDAQVAFVDTPGIHEPRNPLGEYMVSVAIRALNDADAVLFIVDASTPPGADDRRLAELIAARPEPGPVVLALNKGDVLRPENVVPFTDAYRALVPQAEWMLISATRGDNLDPLLDMIIRAFPEGPALYPEDELTQTHLRDLAGEFIREAALNALEQEVPHGIAVEVDEFKERGEAGAFISATIHVERESHKGIAIGRGGAMLKRIGTAARQEIERLLGGKVYLDLHVKVRPNWRKNEADVQRLGYRREK